MAMSLIDEIHTAFPPDDMPDIAITGAGELPSCFAVSDLAVATIGAAGLKLAQFMADGEAMAPSVTVDRRLASFWFDMTLRPQGWTVPSPWDPIAGDYRAKDGWVRLHTNAPHHRNAALRVLGAGEGRDAVARALEGWTAGDLEAAVVAAGGCAAEMRSLDDWAVHPQGKAVASEPLVIWQSRGTTSVRRRPMPGRPLSGVRVLDLTRVLAGPVAGRFLAAYGADVLRIDPGDWDEPGVVPEVTLGKRCAGLDLKSTADRAIFETLLASADVLLHGYRPGALANLGYDAETLSRINPALIDVSHCAYGWSGPWSGRRGFDSLVQMSCGIAHHGMSVSGAEKPVPLPVQALDHATGYLLAAAVLHALDARTRTGELWSARLSLARVAHLLSRTKRPVVTGSIEPETFDDIDPQDEPTCWGAAKRVRFPLSIAGVEHGWDYPAGALRSAEASWR